MRHMHGGCSTSFSTSFTRKLTWRLTACVPLPPLSCLLARAHADLPATAEYRIRILGRLQRRSRPFPSHPSHPAHPLRSASAPIPSHPTDDVIVFVRPVAAIRISFLGSERPPDPARLGGGVMRWMAAATKKGHRRTKQDCIARPWYESSGVIEEVPD